MQQTARFKNNRGFTLIEVMVAIVMLFLSMTATLWALSMAVEHNLKSLMTNEAVQIGEEKMNVLRASAFTAVNTGSDTSIRRFRNFSITFTTNWTVQGLSTNSRAIQVVVTWTWKGLNHQHSTTSIVSTPA
jgi:prepilin-type N-terminal cleavage/methylation domain-containing protein